MFAAASGGIKPAAASRVGLGAVPFHKEPWHRYALLLEML
ncbi:Hypothetical protein OINT_2000210 [Brucella intermedia LMG 3301]|uniref:Uncharacterized protein n=1 Tax=Brucella intermedia LMG 3301 TaxID=641118 RepID=C4WM79_9HYPH|nr:Hypothetical protein OINT_2000210 [Brucella intermedia LMG 3301]